LIKKLALATGNSHKLSELKLILEKFSWEVYSPLELGVIGFSPIEDGTSFQENASIKSNALFQLTKIPSLADDSGLIVNALNGEPGIYSARYGGEGLSDRERALFLLDRMCNKSDRSAKFVCCLAYTDTSGTIFFDGFVEGEIGKNYVDGGGFGYDPIFFYPPKNCHFSELSPKEKNSLSHRGIALKKFSNYIQSLESNS
jgi:XTP/dITP diphosphohydrolase